jgi:glycosyltransferase involved in cell wall biosynthesis
VVASNRTALPEVVGDAGLLVDPDDHAAIADAIERAIGDREPARRGVERAARFTWAETAAQVDALVGRLRHPA